MRPAASPSAEFDRRHAALQTATMELKRIWALYRGVLPRLEPQGLGEELLGAVGAWRDQLLALRAASRTAAELGMLQKIHDAGVDFFEAMIRTVDVTRAQRDQAWRARHPLPAVPASTDPIPPVGPITLAAAQRRQRAVEAELSA
jgi:hypothetical protein